MHLNRQLTTVRIYLRGQAAWRDRPTQSRVEMILQKTRKAIGKFISPLVNQSRISNAQYPHLPPPRYACFRSLHSADSDIFAATQKALDKSAIIRGNILCTFLSSVCILKWKVCGSLSIASIQLKRVQLFEENLI